MHQCTQFYRILNHLYSHILILVDALKIQVLLCLLARAYGFGLCTFHINLISHYLKSASCFLIGISMEGDDALLAEMDVKVERRRDEWMTTLPPERKVRLLHKFSPYLTPVNVYFCYILSSFTTNHNPSI